MHVQFGFKGAVINTVYYPDNGAPIPRRSETVTIRHIRYRVTDVLWVYPQSRMRQDLTLAGDVIVEVTLEELGA